MPLDAICLTAVAAELRRTVTGGKVDKIYQPTRDEVVLHMRTGQGNVRLLLSANPQHPRAHLTEIPRENPETPPHVLYAPAEILFGRPHPGHHPALHGAAAGI